MSYNDGLNDIKEYERDGKKHSIKDDLALDTTVWSLKKAEAEEWEENILVEGIENPDDPLEDVPKEIIEKLDELTFEYEETKNGEEPTIMKGVEEALEIVEINPDDVDNIPNENTISGIKVKMERDAES